MYFFFLIGLQTLFTYNAPRLGHVPYLKQAPGTPISLDWDEWNLLMCLYLHHRVTKPDLIPHPQPLSTGPGPEYVSAKKPRFGICKCVVFPPHGSSHNLRQCVHRCQVCSLPEATLDRYLSHFVQHCVPRTQNTVAEHFKVPTGFIN